MKYSKQALLIFTLLFFSLISTSAISSEVKGQAKLQSTKDPAPGEKGLEESLDVKIGQMILAGFKGIDVKKSDSIVRDIEERHLGGVILYDYDVAGEKKERNIQSPHQVKKLIKDLQSYATIPLIVAIDYEGGKISRLKDSLGFPATVSHQYLGEKDDLNLTYKYATTMAGTLSNLGFNLNLAPVADLMVNPDNPIIAKLERSFSADHKKVSRHVLEFIKASHEQGILTSLKHFPGHGSSATDSHLGMTDVTKTWSSIELEPFKAIIKEKRVDTIMTAHVYIRNLDPHYPATLSRAIITDLLRKKLHYDGVVISDDMGMKAITDKFGFETALLKTIEAGVDIIVISNNTGTSEKDVSGDVALTIKRLVEEGKISEERIDRSFKRIQKLKSRMRTSSRKMTAMISN
ncbi:MAG: glycoside hydrolase family 3 [Proteobacteria bacterium]|nr:glycoside hydrolase family 3 [Pseudomonadota bacterium]